jgi:hypothetical protein
MSNKFSLTVWFSFGHLVPEGIIAYEFVFMYSSFTVCMHVTLNHLEEGMFDGSVIEFLVTHYGLSEPGIEFWYGRHFLHMSTPALGSTQAPVQWVPGLIPRGKVAGACR